MLGTCPLNVSPAYVDGKELAGTPRVTGKKGFLPQSQPTQLLSPSSRVEQLRTLQSVAPAHHPDSVRHWSWWSSSSPGASSCSPTSPHNSTWRALPWCWGPHSSVAFAGPSPRCSCRRRNLVREGPGHQAGWRQAGPDDSPPALILQGSRTPSTPCSTCSHSCFWGSSLSSPSLKVRRVVHLGGTSVQQIPLPCSEPTSVVAAEVIEIKDAVCPLASLV